MLKIIGELLVTKSLLAVAIAYTATLTYFCLVRLGPIEIGSFSPTDKLLHATAYVGLVSIWQFYVFFEKKLRKHFIANLFKVAGLAVLFGMLIEVLQGTLTSYREPDWLDVLANTSGVLLAVILFLIFYTILGKVKKQD